jgi:putative ABC transport system permease protein
MVKKYILMAYRSFARNGLYSIINIAGLTLGIASFIICYYHLSFELTYDKFHQDPESIYRVVTGDMEGDDYWVMMAAPIPPVLKAEFPEIEDYVRMAYISWDPKYTVKVEEKSFNEEHFFLVDPSFFKIFNYKLLLGDPETVLAQTDGVVITSSHALKYFGNEDPLGKTIEINDEYLFKVSGVIEDPPVNSHLDYSFLASFENLSAVYGQNAPLSWGSYNYFAYLKLNPETDPDELRSKIQSYSFQASEEREVSFENIDLQQIGDIHFMSNRGNLLPSYSMIYIYIFWALSIALIVIASINYINFSTAQSEKRIREVALRKTFGASRTQVTRQLLGETLIIAFIALGLAMLGIKLLSPFIIRLLNDRIAISYSDPTSLVVLIGITLIIGITSGIYISLFISGFRPALILKGNIKIRSRDVNVRKALLFVQFVVVSVLIISSLTILKQLRYVQRADLGLNRDHVVDILIFNEEARKSIPLFKNEILRSPLVVSAAASAFKPGEANFNQTVRWEGQEESMSMFLIPADKDFISTMGLTLLEGDIEQIEALPDSSYTWILNESAREIIGWDQAYGKTFTAFGSEKSYRPVSGVVSDFNFMSLHHQVAPLVLVVGNAFGMDRISVRLQGENMEEGISFLESEFKEIFPGLPFEYNFLDEAIDSLYKNETWTGKIIGLITVIIIGISLFGLFGLLSFSLKERTREIAIRKAHGISIPGLTILLTRNYLLLVLLSIMLSLPAAWIMMDRWLQNFSYRVHVAADIIIVNLFLIFFLVIISVVQRTLVAARANPAEALKYV